MRPYTPVHPDPVLESWRWRSFPELNGLGLRCLAEAKDKAMWFGVDKGAMRYDGIHWTTYTEKDGLYGAPVNALCATRDGSVYAGTPMGISRFKEGKWRRVFPPEGDPSTRSTSSGQAGSELALPVLSAVEGSGTKGQALPWSIYRLMEARDGSLWAGTIWGALRLSQEGSILYTTEQMGSALRALAPYVRLSIVPDEAAPARPYGEGIGVGIAQESGWTARRGTPAVIYALAPGGPGEVAGLRVGDRIVAVDGQPGVPQNRLEGTAGPSVRLTVQRNNRPEPFEVTVTRRRAEGTFRDFGTYDVCEDRQGAIWLGLARGGRVSLAEGGEIVRYIPSILPTPHPSEWRLYTEKDGLDIGYLPRIAQTRDGVIWTVSDHGGHGVNRFDGKRWTHFRLSDLGGSDINTSILETQDGTLWVGGFPTLHALRDGAWRVYHSPELPFPTHRSRLLEASDGALWVAGLGQEAARLDYETARWTTYTGLSFQCETPDGTQWFLSQDSSVVRYDGRGWTRYGVEDGLIDMPWRLIATRQGVLWAAGSHDSTVATARFDGKRWDLQTHPRFSFTIYPSAVYESSDGSLWVGAYNTLPERGQLSGVLRFDGKTWRHYTPPEAPAAPYGIGQTADGLLWFGGTGGLRCFNGQAWTAVTEPVELATAIIDAVYAAPKGDLWVGTRFYGVFHYDPSTSSKPALSETKGQGGKALRQSSGQAWTRYDVRDGLADNSIGDILQTADGSVWVATGKGISRFDGRTRSAGSGQAWTTHTLSPVLGFGQFFMFLIFGSLRQSHDGALWINGASWDGKSLHLQTIRYQPDAVPPETEITVSLNRVSQPGNTVLAWAGADPWKATPDEEVQYSYRLDGGDWSPFSHEKSKVFLSLSSGAHTFEVRARDQDFNVDPTPAVMRFVVIPPVWRQPWFIGLIVVFAGITGFQASRIVARDRRLSTANEDLRREMDERRRAEEERARLDERLRQLHYLYRLRAAMGDARSADEIVRLAGEALMEALSPVVSAGVLIEHDGRKWEFGEKNGRRQESFDFAAEKLPLRSGGDRRQETTDHLQSQIQYERPLAWGGKQRGCLRLSCGMDLSESQERALLDETAGQIAAALEARELEAQILQSARLLSLGQMAAGVAHELNQPLGAISATAEDLYLRVVDGLGVPPEKLKGMMQDVMEWTERMAGTIEHLRVFSRDPSGEPGVLFSVNEVIHSGLRMTGAQLQSHGIALRLDLSEGLPPVSGHPHQMEQVFLNLLSNARDALDEKEQPSPRLTAFATPLPFMGEGKPSEARRGEGRSTDHGSRITDHESRGWEKRIVVRTRREGDGVVAEVEDNGIGIDEAHVARLFEPFFTTKPADRGTGLGLSICYAIVRNHGGQITCESRKGEGTVFRVRLPAAEET